MAKPKNSSDSVNRLLSLIERIERLEEERKALAGDIKDIYAEAKSAGFDVKAMRQMIRERAMDPGERDEFQAVLEVYRAALGMLGDTPLGEAARRRFLAPPKPPAAPGGGQEEASEPAPTEAPEAAASATVTPEQVAAARAEGAAAAKAGKPVLDNPHPAGSALRAAWDMGWCGAAGSDGMDIPSAFRRSTPKPSKGAKGAKGGGEP